MSTERRVDRGDYYEVWGGEPTWDDPSVWSSYRVEWKPGTEPYVIDANTRTVTERAVAALSTNATIVTAADEFLAIASPTNAQVLAQVRDLTTAAKLAARQRNGLIRLALQRFDSAD